MTRRVVVINPVAGRRTEAVDIVEAIRRAAGGDVEIRVTEEEGDAIPVSVDGENLSAREIIVSMSDDRIRVRVPPGEPEYRNER